MSLDLARQLIVAEIERAKADWTAYALPVAYDNREAVDLAELTTPYLMVDILWGNAMQMHLGPSPLVRDFGTIVLAAGVKEGAGTADLLKLLQHARPYLQLRRLGQVETLAASLGQRPILRGGYYYQTMSVPFWSTEQASPAP